MDRWTVSDPPLSGTTARRALPAASGVRACRTLPLNTVSSSAILSPARQRGDAVSQPGLASVAAARAECRAGRAARARGYPRAQQRTAVVGTLAGGPDVVHFTLPEILPRLRVLLILDNLTGHKSPTSCCGW